jgi:hypothetical protein
MAVPAQAVELTRRDVLTGALRPALNPVRLAAARHRPSRGTPPSGALCAYCGGLHPTLEHTWASDAKLAPTGGGPTP